MRKKATYLSERVYIRNGKEDIYFNFKRSEYWMDILGEKLLKEICNQNANVLSYLKNGDYSLSVDIKESEILQYLSKKCIEFPLDIAEILKERVAFEPFYAFFVEFGISNLKNELQGLEDSFELNIYDDFKYYLAEQLQAICMRTLIVEMQDYKMADKLHGKDEKEEYEYFCTENMCNPTEIINLMEKYPVLCRCVEDRINNSVCFYKEIIEHFCNDKKEIAEHFCPENQISRITNITTSYSDVHQKGRQVVKIEIDKKMKILYKPHSMENEKAFMSLLQWISQGIGITQLNYEILTHESYSWCSIVKYRECESKEEICNYYKRLGTQLFLYDVDIGNWIDVRNTEKCGGEVGAMAWCHGAAGILLSRLYCNELTDAKLWKERFAKDINRAYKILKKYWIRDSWSLCHGICGNLWILELIDIKEKNNFIYEYAKYLKSFKLLPQELLNPGFMNGYGGIIYSILSNYIPYNS